MSDQLGGDDITLKTLITAATALLRPPTPLPAAPTELVHRLQACSAALPTDWKRRYGWNEEEEEEGVDDNGGPVSAEATKKCRDELRLRVGKRCLMLVEGIQRWLRMEFWSAEFKQGLDTKDCEFVFPPLRALLTT
jgi:hypothetical protein